MFTCKYKYTLEDSIKCAKYVYRSQRRLQDKIIAVMIPILLVAMVGMLVADIVLKRNLIWDIILVVALVVLEIIYLIIPLTLVSQQKKAFKKQGFDEMDCLDIKIENNVITEQMIKDGQAEFSATHNLKNVSSYIEDADRIVLVFNKVEFTCIRKEFLTGGVEKLKALLQKAMQKQKK